MASDVTLKDEYGALMDELRQNRQIQLQSLLATPVWMSLFFGLVSSALSEKNQLHELVLLPIPLVFINLLLLLDRRRSSDVIIAYTRTAIDEQCADKPGWNLLLPSFRRNFAATSDPPSNERNRIPQRFDFNVIVLCCYGFISIVCAVYYGILASNRHLVAWTIVIIVLTIYILMLARVFHQSKIKARLIAAWRTTLKNRP